MAENSEAGGAVKTALEAIKAVIEALHLNPESDRSAAKHGPGPLVVVGRFYISLIVVLAAVTSACAFFDWKGGPPDASVACLRMTLALAICAGLGLSVALLGALVWRHPGYLFAPGELSSDLQMQIMGPTSKDEANKGEDKSRPGAATPAVGAAPAVDAAPAVGAAPAPKDPPRSTG